MLKPQPVRIPARRKIVLTFEMKGTRNGSWHF
jgi:hypothetical protein